ncbi:MAG: DUF1415 domain-containing protein [Aquabacterium sp.]
MHDPVIAETRAWVEQAVIGLNLCPFAKAPRVKGLVRYVASTATQPQALLDSLVDELQRLAATPTDQCETTLLIHPHVLGDFADYNDFLALADAAVQALGLDGVIQVASFHPRYRFAGVGANALSNATNRSPYPMLHLLREDSITRAVQAMPDPAAIYDANVASLRRLGRAGWAALQARCREDAARDGY